MNNQHDKKSSKMDRTVQSHHESIAQLIKHQQQQQQQQQQQHAIIQRVLMQQQTLINRLLENQQEQHRALTRILQQQLKVNEVNQKQLVIDMSEFKDSRHSVEPVRKRIDNTENDYDYNHIDNNNNRGMVVEPHEQQQQQKQVNSQHGNELQHGYKRDIKLPLAPARNGLSAQTISNIQRHQTLKTLLVTNDVKKYVQVINTTATKLVLQMLNMPGSQHGTPWKDLGGPLQQYGKNALESELLKQSIPIWRCCNQWFAAQTMEQVWNHQLQTLQRDNTRTKRRPYHGISATAGSNSVPSSETPINTTKRRQRQPKTSVSLTINTPTETQSSPTEPKNRKRKLSISSTGGKRKPRRQPEVTVASEL